MQIHRRDCGLRRGPASIVTDRRFLSIILKFTFIVTLNCHLGSLLSSFLPLSFIFRPLPVIPAGLWIAVHLEDGRLFSGEWCKGRERNTQHREINFLAHPSARSRKTRLARYLDAGKSSGAKQIERLLLIGEACLPDCLTFPLKRRFISCPSAPMPIIATDRVGSRSRLSGMHELS